MTGKILVTGASGQLGQEFVRIAKETKKDEFIFWTKAMVNICATDAGHQIRRLQPAILINCAAYTDVDQAESQAKQAYEVNAEAVKNLASITNDLSIPMIHFSSDYVYHNHLRRPLLETDPLHPKSVYAKSKLKGEKLLQAHHQFPLIFRTSWLYSTFGKNFPKTILRLASDRNQLNVVRDQLGAPTYARDLALGILKIIDQMRDRDQWSKVSGVYNFSNEGMTNWAEIASFVVHFSQLNCQINPISSREFPTAAVRPRFSKLNLSKFKQTFDQEIRPWRDALEECLSELQTKNR